jgi:hypothetical protein
LTPSWHPVDPGALAGLLAARVAAMDGFVRVAVDGAAAAGPHALADSLLEPLRALGRPVEHVRADRFLRDASVRLEYGHTDVQSFRDDWLDVGALTREVLEPLAAGGKFLTSLRDPVTNRAIRDRPRTPEPRQVVLVSGELLLDHGLPFDLTIHLSLSAAALARRTPEDLAWTLDAFDGYEDQITADVVIKVDDPRHPALRTP